MAGTLHIEHDEDLACFHGLFDPQINELVWRRRRSNAQAGEINKLGVRGTFANGVAKVEAVKAGQPPPVWFVFSGAPWANAASLCCLLRDLC